MTSGYVYLQTSARDQFFERAIQPAQIHISGHETKGTNVQEDMT
jgi:hypothetical protein